MAKLKYNPLLKSMSGQVGDLIFYEADGQTLSRRAPRINKERKPKQLANSTRFAAAGLYAKAVLSDPEIKAAYQAACQGHLNARNVAIRDAMTPPVIHTMELSGYRGKPGEVIRVNVTDDFKVQEVQLVLRTAQGELIEEGLAASGCEKSEWRYVAKVEVAAGQSISVTATARDMPGNIAQCQRWQYLEPSQPQ